jgi:putative ABC transport system permease protein
MGLAALVSVLLAGVAIAVAAQRYASRHQAVAAILRCLGARQPWILRLYLGQIAAAGLLACLVGCALGYGAQSLLAALLADLFPSDLPPPSFLPVLQGLATGLVALLGFALPPLLRLRQVPPVRVFSRELGALPGQAWQGYGLALAALVVLLYWQAQDATLTLYVLGGSFAALLSLVGIALLLIRSLAKLRGRVGVAWRFGMANIARHTTGSVLQVVAFGVGIMALLLLTFVRNDLLQGWQRTLPAETPNFFLINVQPDEVPALQAYLAGRGFAHSLYPMVRARLMAINERPVFAQEFQDPRAQRLVEREFNLSWAEGLAGDNRIVEGRWWSRTEHGDPLLSVEQGVAETVGISLGDTLTFFIAGQQIQGRIVSIREVDWDSFRVNFFVLTPPGILEAFPATYVTSFYLPEAQKTLLSDLVHRFPSVTALDVHALIGKVRAIMEQVSLGMQTIFLFTFLAGLCILYAAIQSTLDERKLETAILRTLGADRTRLILGLYAEFATLGLLAGILGALGATVLGMVLAVQVFDLSYQPDLWIWVLGIVGGGVGVGLAGLLGTYSVLTQPPIRTLREL